MSTVLLFRSQYFRSDVNIQDCFTVERQCRLTRTVDERPWAAALSRLLATVRRKDGTLWKKGELAEKAGMRAGNISAMLHSPTCPEIPTLQALAKALGVPLWEFFVSDEQAAILHAQAKQRASLMGESEIAARVEHTVMTKLAHLVKEATREITSSQELVPSANPLPTPKPTLAPSIRPKRRHAR